MTPPQTSRRGFVRAVGTLGGAAVLSRYLPGGWVFAQANSLDAMRAQMGGTPIQKTALAPG